MQHPGIKEVIAVAASKSSARTIDTKSERDGYVMAKCINKNTTVQSIQLISSEEGKRMHGLPT